jgi:hypothetical protein
MAQVVAIGRKGKDDSAASGARVQAAELIKALGEALIATAATMGGASTAPSGGGQDRWLTPQETAQRMGVSVRWLHRRWRRLSFCRPLPGGARGYRASERELEQSMERR